MADDNHILSKRVKIKRKQSLIPYKKEFRKHGELNYDLASRKRIKCAYSIGRQETRRLSSQTEVSETVETRVSSSSLEGCLPTCSNIIQPSTSSTVIPGTSSSNQDELILINEPFLADEELYMNLLNSDSKAVTISDGIGVFMVIPDLNNEKHELKKDQLILLERKAVSFNHEPFTWVCLCNCQPIWSREIRSSSEEYCTSHQEFLRQYPQCLHRKIGTVIFEQYDNVHDINPIDFLSMNTEGTDHGYHSTELEIVEASRIGSVPVARVWSEKCKSHGLVTVSKGKLVCLCCHKNYCDHCNILKSLSDELVNIPVVDELLQLVKSDNTTSSGNASNKITCHSFRRLSVPPTEEIKSCFNTGIVTNLDTHDENLVCLPEDVLCRHCGGDLDAGCPITNRWIARNNATIVTKTHLDKGNVYYRPCLQCDSVTLFDGKDKCLLNMGSYLVGHDVLRSYMHSFQHGRRPLYTFYSVFVDDHQDYGNTKIMEEFSYHKLRAAWLSYLNLLDIDFTQGFSCPHCPGDNGPDIIICDGTSLSFQRRMWTWKNQESPKDDGPNKKSGFKERIFLPDAKLRKLLFRYATGGTVVRGKHSKPLTSDEKKELLKKLSAEFPTLSLFLKSVDDGTLKLPRHCMEFITSLSSKSPVCGYIHPCKEVQLLIMDLVNGEDIKKDPVKWQKLHTHVPVLFNLFENSKGSSAPPEVRPLLEELWELAVLPFENYGNQNDLPPDNLDDEMAFFPSLPKLRGRGNYPMDKKKANKTCKKTFKGHPSLLPGIFTLYCPHGEFFSSSFIASIAKCKLNDLNQKNNDEQTRYGSLLRIE